MTDRELLPRLRQAPLEDQYVGGVRGGGSGSITWHGFHWWPTPGMASLGPEVPPEVADAYGEALRCLSAGAPNGAAAMLRTAMTQMVNDKGSDAAKAKGDLKEKIKQMIAEGGLSATIGEWVDHVRLYGNAGAHPDLFGDVPLEEAKDVAGLTATLIELLYTTPDRGTPSTAPSLIPRRFRDPSRRLCDRSGADV